MSLPNGRDSSCAIADVLGSMRRKGVKLWSENGQLRYKAPRNALEPQEIEALKEHKVQIMAFLEGTAEDRLEEPLLESCGWVGRAPLASSQRVHWELLGLRERPSLRQVSTAILLRGPLQVGLLRRAVTEVVRRHDALRTQVVIHDGTPVQVLNERANCSLSVDDLTTSPEGSRYSEVKRLIERLIAEPVNVAVDPLCAMRLWKVHDHEHVLAVAMEHMISDAFSQNIALREILTAYEQLSKGHNPCLPAIPIQLPDYAIWQKSAQKFWLERHRAYWDERLIGCPRLEFPEDRSPDTAARVGWGSVPVVIGRQTKVQLREWCRLRRTTLVMAVFVAYVALVLRTCRASAGVVQYQSDGRRNPKTDHTIGYLASALYLRVELSEQDTLIGLLHRATAAYCAAQEHGDFSYMPPHASRSEFVRSSMFNWVPCERGSVPKTVNTAGGALEWSPVSFDHPALANFRFDRDPVIQLFETEEEIVGGVQYPTNRFSPVTMETFGRNLVRLIGSLLHEPDRRVTDVRLE